MTREERQKAINALKKSAPIMAMTQQEFSDYIQTLNQVMDWLEQEPTTKNGISNKSIIYKAKESKEIQKDLDELRKLNEPTKNGLGVDCISRQAVIDMTGLSEWFDSSDSYNEFVIALSELPPVTPQEPVVDKIIAEITELDNEVCQRFLIEDIDKEVHHTYQECLDIIDKYKAESEG